MHIGRLYLGGFVWFSRMSGPSLYEGQPAAYWLDQSYAAEPQRQHRAIKALQQFPADEAAAARLAEIRDAVAETRERNWQAMRNLLRDAKQTKEHAAEILHHLENCPDQPGPDLPYSPIGFPGRGQELRQLLKGRCDATTGADRPLHADLRDALERR